jgi:hypothetical protein
MLLRCPVAFERDHPQAGEAEIIVAKHSAGPCRTFTVASQLHLNRFSNMARGGYGCGVFSSLMSFSHEMSRRCPTGHGSEISAVRTPVAGGCWQALPAG